MQEHREHGNGQEIRTAETRAGDAKSPAPPPAAFMAAREGGAESRPRLSVAMPNGDPPSWVLWGVEER